MPSETSPIQASAAPARPSDGLVYVSGAWRDRRRGLGQRLRSRPALRRRRVRRHPRLQRPRLQARTPHRSAVRLGQGDPARDPADARGGLRRWCVETCRRNGISDGYIRLVVTRGPGDLGIDPRKCPRAELIVIARQLTMYAAAAAGIKVVTSTFRRNAPDATSPSIKSLNYLNNILARIEANDRGADEALMLDGQGYVAEATVDNFFIVTERRAADAADRDQPERDHPRDAARGRGQPRDQGRGAAVHAVRRLDVEGGVHLRHRCRSRAGAVGRRPDDRRRRDRPGHPRIVAALSRASCARRARRFQAAREVGECLV